MLNHYTRQLVACLLLAFFAVCAKGLQNLDSCLVEVIEDVIMRVPLLHSSMFAA
jgi:hypothetical protein